MINFDVSMFASFIIGICC